MSGTNLARAPPVHSAHQCRDRGDGGADNDSVAKSTGLLRFRGFDLSSATQLAQEENAEQRLRTRLAKLIVTDGAGDVLILKQRAPSNTAAIRVILVVVVERKWLSWNR
jgi:hypothetical protein